MDGGVRGAPVEREIGKTIKRFTHQHLKTFTYPPSPGSEPILSPSDRNPTHRTAHVELLYYFKKRFPCKSKIKC